VRKIALFAFILVSCHKQADTARFAGTYYGASNCAADAGYMAVEPLSGYRDQVVLHDPTCGDIKATVTGDTLLILLQTYCVRGHTITIEGKGTLIDGDMLIINTFSREVTGTVADSCFYYGHKKMTPSSIP